MTIKSGPNKAKKTVKKQPNKKKVVRRGKSKLTLVQAADAPKDSMEAFRCDEQLKSFLDSLPKGRKSNFIIEAVYEKISQTQQVTCPLCKGYGKLGSNVKVKKI